MERPERSAVLVFARAPRADAAEKLRTGRASPAGTDVAALLLSHTLEVARQAGPAPLLAADAGAARLAPAGIRVLPQRGDTFGDRFRHAVADAFAAGFGRVIVVGADVPGLTPSLIREAEARLEAGDEGTVVIGPSCDGGYFLIGFNRFDERAFAGIPWRTRHVLKRTKQALRDCRLSFLPCLTDADDAGSLRRALADVSAAGAALRGALARLLAALVPVPLPAAVFLFAPALTVALPVVRRGPPASRRHPYSGVHLCRRWCRPSGLQRWPALWQG